MPWTFNPFTGKLDQTAASGGGGGNPFDQSLNTTDNPTFPVVSINDGSDGTGYISPAGVFGQTDNGHASHWYLSKNSVSFDNGDDSGPATSLVHGSINYTPDVSVSTTPIVFTFPSSTGTLALTTDLPDQSLNMADGPLFNALTIDTYIQYSPTNGSAVPVAKGITYFDTVNNSFYGYVTGLSTGLRKFTMGDASDLTSGTLNAARLPSTAVTTTGTQTLTNKSISSGQITGLAAVATSASAADLSTGTLPDARLSSNVLLLTGAQTITGTKTITPAAGSSALIASNVTHTTSAPILDLTQTWNASAVAFSAIKLSVTNTASATASALLDLSVGGTSQFHVTPAKQIRLFNSRTDASNYECGVLDWTTNTNALTIGTQKAGTGTARRVRLNSAENIDYYISDSSRVFQMASNGNTSFSPLTWQYYSGAGDPTTSNTPWNNGASYCALWRNTTTGVVKLWVNNAGTMVSVALS